MYPPCSTPMEAATAARCGGVLLQSRTGSSRARARTWGHGMLGVGYPSPSAAWRRLLVASLGVRESLPAQSPGEEAVVTVEVEESADDCVEILPSPDVSTNTNTVRVKFVLEKECAFGQHFLLVGDDPALGLWDPAKASALEWSEGHVWTVKTDLPANKLIEFKFLLRDEAGQVRWQDGDNRTLQTTDTPNTLVVNEDWDHDENQKVSEEEELWIAEEDLTLSDDLALEGGSGTMLAVELQSGKNLDINKSAIADAWEMKGANEENQPQFVLEEDRKILNELHGQADTAPQNGNPFDDDNTRPNEDYNTAMCLVDTPIANGSNSVFENDLAWARKALQQVLRFLGFQIGTTRT